jgi:D-inositol-3-phosphate glycosyltransferase
MTDKKINISCVSAGFGGLELNTLKLALWLKEYGWQVSMLLLKDSHMHKAAAGYCDEVHVIPGGRFLKWKKTYYMRKWLKIKKRQILFTALSKDITAAAIYKRLFNKKIIIVYQQQMKVGVNKRDLIHRLRYNMVNIWISPLLYLKEETLSRTTISAEKIKVIPLCIEEDKFLNSTITKDEARTNLGLPLGVKIIGVLGRLDPEKGQDFLIRCIKRLRDNYGLNYELLIMGEKTIGLADDYNDLLHSLIKESGISDSIHFRPFTYNVSVFYKAIDVFAMASKGEPFGMVTIEAMASCCPVISTNKDGPAEILKGGELGYLFDNNDEEGFCKQLIAMSQNPLLPEMLKRAENVVRTTYSKQNLCKQLDELFIYLLTDD